MNSCSVRLTHIFVINYNKYHLSYRSPDPAVRVVHKTVFSSSAFQPDYNLRIQFLLIIILERTLSLFSV